MMDAVSTADDNAHLYPPDTNAPSSSSTAAADDHLNPKSANGSLNPTGETAKLTQEQQDELRRQVPFPSCRLVMTVMAFLGFFNAYTLRVNLSVAIVAMVNTTRRNQQLFNSTEPECEGELDLTGHDGEFNWDTHVQGNVLAAFFYGYLANQVLGGWLADRLGGRWFYGGGILGTSLMTLLAPPAARWHVNALIVTRVLQGLGEGAMIPAMHALYAAWTPPAERSRTVTIVFSGTELGTIVGMLLSGVLCDRAGWPSVFYVFGTIGVVWSIAWLALCHNSPADHPRISAAERTYIEAAIGNQIVRAPTPWRKMLTSPPVWACALVHFGHNWGYYTLLTCLPRYMHDVLLFNIKENGLLSCLPYIAAWVVMLSGGQLADWLRAPSRLSTTVVRKMFCTAGVLLPGLFLIISGFLGCDRASTVLMIVFAVGCSALTISGYSVNILDLAPGHAGTIMGLTNSVATVASMLAPQVVGAVIYEESTRARWQIVFYIAAAIYTLGAIIFLVFGSGDQQEWAKNTAPESNLEELNEAAHGYMTLNDDWDSTLPQQENISNG